MTFENYPDACRTTADYTKSVIEVVILIGNGSSNPDRIEVGWKPAKMGGSEAPNGGGSKYTGEYYGANHKDSCLTILL